MRAGHARRRRSRRRSRRRPSANSASKQLERIYVERPAYRARTLQLLDLRQPGTEEAVQVAAVRALDEQLRVVAPGAPGHRRRHRTQETHAPVGTAGEGTRLSEECERRLACLGGVTQRCEARKRWPGGLRALLERGGGEAVVAVREQALQQRVLGELGLDQHLPGARSAARPPRNLHDGLRQAFRGTEVGAEEALISVQYHDQ